MPLDRAERGPRSPSSLALRHVQISAIGTIVGAGLLGWQIGTHGIDGELRLFLELAFFVGVLPGLILSVVRLQLERQAKHPGAAPGEAGAQDGPNNTLPRS
jgi:hypothetical protein